MAPANHSPMPPASEEAPAGAKDSISGCKAEMAHPTGKRPGADISARPITDAE